MSMTQGIFWLASYPKSGNTWFRIVLANALRPSHQPLSINQINITRHASDRKLFVEALGFNSYLLSEQELLQLRPLVYQWYSKKNAGVHYFKIHDAYIYTNGQTPLVPCDGSLGVLYFIRNPLDIAISFAHHSGISIEQSISLMCDENARMFGGTGFIGMQLQQYLLSWSRHVHSWTTTNHPLRVMCLRYEDMHRLPLITFRKALQFLNLELSDNTILTAIEQARFENLQHQESQQTFREKLVMQERFFRKGIIGDWEQTLNSFQIKRIIKHHQDVMFKYGYIDENNEPIRYHTKETNECIV